LADLLGAAGLKTPGHITPQHLMVRNAEGRARTLASSIDTLTPGQLLNEKAGPQSLPSPFDEFWHVSHAGHWGVPESAPSQPT
jgi:hypothetical protein